MRYLILLLALALFGCSKDEKSVNGTYLVTGKEGVHQGNGTISINGSSMAVDVLQVMQLTNIDVVINGTSISVPNQSFGGSSNLTITSGTGTITPNAIQITMKVTRWGNQFYTCNFNGSK